ncbi:MAG: hypothetical protein M1825_002222 [Sarcosagium campestre]|nr:MAG: hypothetical protein M1825_002222 [Sarcosagium campestre]
MSPSSSRSTTPPSTKRLLHELQLQAQDPSSMSGVLAKLGPISDAELLHWEAVLKGVSGTPYADGLWKLDIQIPESYPMQAPVIRFVTPVCHPNVNIKTGEICLDLLKESWSPAYMMAQTLASVQQLLADPEPDSPLNVDIAALLRSGDQVGAESLVRYYTQEYRWTG